MKSSKVLREVYVVCGPTATGKTSLALDLATKVSGELINADSRQVYKYLSVGTNVGHVKLIKKFSPPLGLPLYSIKNIPIHLLQFLNPNENFDLKTYQAYAFLVIKDILRRNKTPIIVGGTGLYIDSIINKYKINGAIPNWELRAKLDNLTVQQLQNELKMLDFKAFTNLNNSDAGNKRRLIRLIEKARFQKENKIEALPKRLPAYNFKVIYPEFDWQSLRQAITLRAYKMFDEGLVNEVKKVLKMGFSKDSIALRGIGFSQVIEYIEGRISIEECKKLTAIAHIQYARRQKTWFNNKLFKRPAKNVKILKKST